MNKKSTITPYAAGLFFLTLIILLHPAQCLSFALNGLNLWFQKMIPALFPFMVLSGIMIRMNLTDTFVSLLAPILRPIFRLRNSCLYVIFMGFLCGFPMGAHVTAQLYMRKQLTQKEAELLLAFCNNIGPVYFISFALPTIGINNKLLPLIGMYGIPLLYGLVLRYTVYADRIPIVRCKCTVGTNEQAPSFLTALDESVTSALSGIARLGGYMIFFNLLNILPMLYFPQTAGVYCSCILEITGGLQTLQNESPIFALCALAFGGLSCLAQTYSMIQESDLSLKKYLFHKTVLTVFSVIYYVALTSISF